MVAIRRTHCGHVRRAVVCKGALADPESDDPKVLAPRQLHEAIAAEGRVSATTIQAVGSEGYDGFMVALAES